MKLSEAIRLGATLGPQTFTQWRGQNDSTCAIGAAMAAIGLKNGLSGDVEKRWPELRRIMVEYPTNKSRCCLFTAILFLNDNERWSREQIADWVASVEPQDEQTDGGQGPVQTTLEVTAV